MSSAIIITCEHGGNHIPSPYKSLFKDKSDLLQSHRGWESGALELAQVLANNLHCPLFSEKSSRLGIDQNRSRSSKHLFSEITGGLSWQQKNKILNRIYDPYHNAINCRLAELMKVNNPIYHFSIHSFTPVLNGETRNADLGFLYDPARNLEMKLCLQLTNSMRKEISGIRIRRNYPYKGTSDGLTTALRKKISEKIYCGVEIEFNQYHYAAKTEIWFSLIRKLPLIIRDTVLKI